jgi:TIR domain
MNFRRTFGAGGLARKILSDDSSRIFICFSSKDEAIACEVVEFLESKGLKCWISSRDVPPGQNYQETIVQAIESALGMVFLFSEASSKSREIKKELSIGGSVNLPVFPVRLDPILPSGALRYELAIRQWIDIFPHRKRALTKLAETIKAGIEAAATVEIELPPPTQGVPVVGATSKLRPLNKKHRMSHKPIVVPGTEGFEKIRALLARHIGPIAKIYVQKAASEASSPEDFCKRLAIHVVAPSERTSFVQAVRAQLATKT